MNQLIKKFNKNGIIRIKNFFTDEEVREINDRAKNLIENKYDFLYVINNVKIKNAFLSKKKFNKLKELLLEKCIYGDYKVKSLELFIELLVPIIKKCNLDESYIQNLHNIFCENFDLTTDLLEDEVFSKIFLKDKVLNLYKELLGSNELVYHGESSLSFNKPPVTGWHSDDQINYSLNASIKTFQIRGGFFYQSEEGRSGGTKFLHGSHYFISPSKLLKKIIKKIIRNKSFDNSIFNTRLLTSKNYFPGKKDFCLWDKRIIHSPWSIKLKIFPNLSLKPFLEKHLLKNDYLRNIYEKKSFPRSLGSLDFGRDSVEYDAYLVNLSNRTSYKEYWNKKKHIINDKFLLSLSNKKIKFNNLCFKS